ncbi:helix-turn-helix domain-containing protein [Chryseobacterium sp. NRRL B-14859]|uniref:helix-turn-helix domain-containing protein n=1 Tax=unclassified Chryseobacterium TaxID=2593645 RepID=UPI000F44C2DB|nr:helix-turn-helix domain-containing protein [Chryseobacterium sp. G0240]ROI06681.1 helix-turn-helix domain-containing protein [Chryseobacterium sp. G0240]
MKEVRRPNYKKLYTDILDWKYPEKKEICAEVLKKRKLEALDVITLNEMIFGDSKSNQRHKSYDKNSILEILDYQKKNSCSNTELSLLFKMSRNTITKWKRMYV